MPDININRLEDIANVPEIAEADEVGDMALLLMEAQSVLKLRNSQNRSLSSDNMYLATKTRKVERDARGAWIGYWVSWTILASMIIYLLVDAT